MRQLIILLSLFIAIPSFGEIYKQVNEDGSVSFSDAPASSKDEKVELKTGNTVEPYNPPRNLTSDRSNKTKNIYQSILVTNPENDANFHNLPYESSIKVTIAASPSLQGDDKYQLMVNGEPYGKKTTNTSFNLSKLDRGTHTIVASIVSKKGSTILSSDPISFHVHRFSKLFKKAPTP